MIASSITALLGPTNTGKTHRAVERMLDHASGMIGLPLRLLAREVYDRLTLRLGESAVALVTGEEKRIPPSPAYWVCTVEAMPMEREVDFLAVDEIQLAGNDQRGHVFTDRLLRGRGRQETWFLGAATMRPLVERLVPTAKILAHPRLSSLAFGGAQRVERLAPRSAIVAFGAQDVYAIAERVRARHGGAAIVLGALSPRTRNAQVAMFQAGEVDYLVATDAIGMGLNLDVAHVAFGALRKFDGRDVRALDAAEIAQIAGRAGRYLADGTFGTLLPLELSQATARAVEEHRFDDVRRILWRNHDLDLSSIDALLASLRARPPAASLKLQDDAIDAAALARLATDAAIRRRASKEEGVRLLWDVCRIPDFRRLLLESHVALLTSVFDELTGPRARLDDDYLARHVDAIDDPTGDIDTLLGRIAAIRTWTFVAHVPAWVASPAEWQARTRAVEDRLSDALHDRLVQRFVDRAARPRAPKKVEPRSSGSRSRPTHPNDEHGARDLPSHPFAALATFRLSSAQTETRAPRSPAIDALVEARHEDLAVDAGGRISFRAAVVGELARGPTLLLPDARVANGVGEGAGDRSRAHRRLVAFARDLVNELLAPLRAGSRAEPALRGLLYLLEQGLGTLRAMDARAELATLTARDRAHLEALDVVWTGPLVDARALSTPRALEARAAIVRAFHDPAPRPTPGAPSFEPRGVDARACAAIGYPVFGPRAIRADVVRRLLAEAESLDVAAAAQLVGCRDAELPAIAAAMRDDYGDPSAERNAASAPSSSAPPE